MVRHCDYTLTSTMPPHWLTVLFILVFLMAEHCFICKKDFNDARALRVHQSTCNVKGDTILGKRPAGLQRRNHVKRVRRKDMGGPLKEAEGSIGQQIRPDEERSLAITLVIATHIFYW